MPRSRWIKQLGAADQIVEWLKPANNPSWMNAEQFAALPTSITVRELRYTIHEKGFRPNKITLVTTLLDSERYTLSDLASQFQERWEIETNFGHLKTTMKMGVLKCKTVEGVLRELQVFVLIYNMVCQVVLEAASRQQAMTVASVLSTRCVGCKQLALALSHPNWSSIFTDPIALNRASKSDAPSPIRS